ncbi:MAG: SGNH/GDSL hydrolase family protein [Coriobacteriales bacterium]|nr:SGNH/GDSL hydrolase family protein [Coriobacteriales bacterium]
MTRTTGSHMGPTRRRSRWPLAIAGALVVAGVIVGLLVWRPWDRGATQAPATQAQTTSASAPAEQTEQTEQAEQEKQGETPMEQESAKTSLAADFAAGKVRSVRLVGDSITAGYGTDGYEDPNFGVGGNVIYDNGWGTVFYETPESADCWANAFRAYAAEHGVSDFVNAGINGAFMTELAQDPQAWVGEGADVVFVALGTNDAGYYGPGEYADAARTALDYVEQHASTVVVVSPVSDLRPEYQLVEPAASLGDVLREICDERGYLFVDARDAVSPDQFCDDGLHPNSQGSLAIWDCICQTLGL